MRTNNACSYILAFVLAIIPVAYCYAFPFVINNLGHALFLFVALPILLVDGSESSFRGSKRKYCKPYLFFGIYLALITFIAPLFFSFPIDTLGLFSAIEFAIVIFFLIADIKLSNAFIELYTRLAFIFALFLIIQYVSLVFFGTPISGNIPFLEEYEREVGSIIEGRIVRISSVFAEPSHFSVYEAPALVMFLWGKTKQKWPIIKIVVITIAVLLSTSSNGIIVMGFIYATYIINRYFSKLNIIYIIIGTVLFIGAYYFITNSTYLNDVTYGLFTQEEGMTTSKAEGRIYRGYYMYMDMPLECKIFGVGWRNAEAYCQASNPELLGKYAYDGFNYFNSLAGSLIFAGIIGFVALLSFFFSLFKFTNDYSARVLIVAVLILMGTSSVLLSDQWIFFLAAIVSLINKSKDEENYNYYISQHNGNCK